MKRALLTAVITLAFVTVVRGSLEPTTIRIEGDDFDPAIRSALQVVRPDLTWSAEDAAADYRVRILSPASSRPYPRVVEILVELKDTGAVISGDAGRCRFREDLVGRLERTIPLLVRAVRNDAGRHRLDVPEGVRVRDGDLFGEREGWAPVLDPDRAPWYARTSPEGGFWLEGVPNTRDAVLVMRRIPDRLGRVAIAPAGSAPGGSTRIAWTCGTVRGSAELTFDGAFEIQGLPRGHDLAWEVRLPDGTRRDGRRRVPLQGIGRVVVETPAVGFPLRLHLAEDGPRPGPLEVYVDGSVEPNGPRAFDAQDALVLTVPPGPHQVRIEPADAWLEPFVVDGVGAGHEPIVRFAVDVSQQRGRDALESPAFRALAERILASSIWRGGVRGELPIVSLATWYTYWNVLPEPDREACVPLWSVYLLGDYARLETLQNERYAGMPEAQLEARLLQAEGLIFLQGLLARESDDGASLRARAALVQLHLMRLLFEDLDGVAEPITRYDDARGLSTFSGAWDPTTERVVPDAWTRLATRRPFHASRPRVVLLRALALQSYFGPYPEEAYGVEATLEWRVRSKALAQLAGSSTREETSWAGRLMPALPVHLRHPAFLPFD